MEGNKAGGASIQRIMLWVSATEPEGPADAVLGSSTQHNLVLRQFCPLLHLQQICRLRAPLG
jgi:hypothetical protein